MGEMTNENAIRWLKDLLKSDLPMEQYQTAIEKGIEALEQEPKWISITSRPMTEEEKEHYKTHPEYQDDCRIFNCKLPDDGQEVLISVYGGAEVDTFIQDTDDGCYFEGRDIDEVDAWMPLPQPYKAEVEPQESEEV